jgi:hypothetical protein
MRALEGAPPNILYISPYMYQQFGCNDENMQGGHFGEPNGKVFLSFYDKDWVMR